MLCSKRRCSVSLAKLIPRRSPETFSVGWSANEKIQSSRRAFSLLAETLTSIFSRSAMNSFSEWARVLAMATRPRMSATHE